MDVDEVLCRCAPPQIREIDLANTMERVMGTAIEPCDGTPGSAFRSCLDHRNSSLPYPKGHGSSVQGAEAFVVWQRGSLSRA